VEPRGELRGGPNGHLCHDLAAADIPSCRVAAVSRALAGAFEIPMRAAVEEAVANEGVAPRLCGATWQSSPGHWPCTGRACGRDDSVISSLPSGPWEMLFQLR
jgi:hypothetical protein